MAEVEEKKGGGTTTSFLHLSLKKEKAVLIRSYFYPLPHRTATLVVMHSAFLTCWRASSPSQRRRGLAPSSSKAKLHTFWQNRAGHQMKNLFVKTEGLLFLY